MKYTAAVLGLTLLLAACGTETNSEIGLNQAGGSIANCPQPPDSPPPVNIKADEDQGFYNAFNYQVRSIEANKDIIRFQSGNHDFVFCRGNNSWIIQPPTLAEEPFEEKSYEQLQQEWANPPYVTLDFNGETYQYRVLLDPNPFPDFTQEAEQVIFELVPPGGEEPHRIPLYTLADVERAKTGIQLGFPFISDTVQHNNRLFWAVSPEQGEGNGGIATIVSYDPKSDQVVVIQPKAIQGQQINDLVIGGKNENLTFWMATQQAGEGNPYLPSLGLVAYRPNPNNLKSGNITAYHVRNSSIVGAIPTQLHLEPNQLWVTTGNGICRVTLSTVNRLQDWSCWRFAIMANVPNERISLYPTLLAATPEMTLDSEMLGETVEVLWWLPMSYETRKGRYEVRFEEGFEATLDEGGMSLSEFYQTTNPPLWEGPVYWPGYQWHWNGAHFERGLDEVSLNYFGGGPSGLRKNQESSEFISDMYAIRGELELLNLTENSTRLKYFSGWVEEDSLNPYLSIIPDEQPNSIQPNPLKEIVNQL